MVCRTKCRSSSAWLLCKKIERARSSAPDADATDALRCRTAEKPASRTVQLVPGQVEDGQGGSDQACWQGAIEMVVLQVQLL